MTREDARLTLQENLGYLSFEHPGRITEAIKVAIEALSKPSLLNLDDAAEEFASKAWIHGSVWYEASKNTFKAGAEWMAAQGVSLSHLIAWYIQSVDAHEPTWTKEHLEELVKDYILIHKN